MVSASFDVVSVLSFVSEEVIQKVRGVIMMAREAFHLVSGPKGEVTRSLLLDPVFSFGIRRLLAGWSGVLSSLSSSSRPEG